MCQSQLLTKIGDDANGASITNELVVDGVDTRPVLMSEKTKSAFTYILVDDKHTRTCIHTPQSEELTPSEVDAAVTQSEGVKRTVDLDEIDLVHLDSRHTKAACR